MKDKVKRCLKENKVSILILFILAIFIFIICNCNMFAQDEYNYSNITWTTQRITSLSDIVTSLKLIYQNWSGRLLALGLVQLLLFLGIDFYNILNSIIFIIFIYFIGKIFGKKNTILGIATTIFLVLCTVRTFWEKFIWVSGSLNYLWPVTAMLVTMYYFYNIVKNDKKLKNIEILLFMAIAFITGWSHENTAFVTGMFIIVLILLNLKKIFKFEKKTIIYLISTIILFGIGAIILIFAPGNFGRLGETDTSLYINAIIKNVLTMKILIAAFILSSTFIIFLLKKRGLKILRDEICYFVIPAIIALLPMLIIHEFPPRAMLAYETCILVATVNNILEIEYIVKKSKKLYIGLILIFLTLGTVVIGNKAWFAYKYIKPYKEELKIQLEYNKMAGRDNAVVLDFKQRAEAERLDVLMDMFPKQSSLSIINEYIARYYGFDSVTALPENCVMIQIDFSGEEVITDYLLKNRETGEIISNRIQGTVLQMPNKDYKNKIEYVIPEEYLKKVYIELPQEIVQRVTAARLIYLDRVEEFDISDYI